MRKERIKQAIRGQLADYLEALKWDARVSRAEVLEALVEYVIEVADEEGMPASSFDSLVNLTRMALAGAPRQNVTKVTS